MLLTPESRIQILNVLSAMADQLSRSPNVITILHIYMSDELSGIKVEDSEWLPLRQSIKRAIDNTHLRIEASRRQGIPAGKLACALGILEAAHSLSNWHAPLTWRCVLFSQHAHALLRLAGPGCAPGNPRPAEANPYYVGRDFDTGMLPLYESRTYTRYKE